MDIHTVEDKLIAYQSPSLKMQTVDFDRLLQYSVWMDAHTEEDVWRGIKASLESYVQVRKDAYTVQLAFLFFLKKNHSQISMQVVLNRLRMVPNMCEALR